MINVKGRYEQCGYLEKMMARGRGAAENWRGGVEEFIGENDASQGMDD